MRAFLWLGQMHPEGLGDGAVVGVAAARAVDAARLLRRGGWHKIKPEAACVLKAGDAWAVELLAAPGVVMWRAAVDDDDKPWHRSG